MIDGRKFTLKKQEKCGSCGAFLPYEGDHKCAQSIKCTDCGEYVESFQKHDCPEQ